MSVITQCILHIIAELRCTSLMQCRGLQRVCLQCIAPQCLHCIRKNVTTIFKTEVNISAVYIAAVSNTAAYLTEVFDVAVHITAALLTTVYYCTLLMQASIYS